MTLQAESKSRIVAALWMTLWMGMSLISLVEWIEVLQLKFIQPEFAALTVSRGTLSFSTQWKSSGGRAVISVSGSDISLTCGGPYHEEACFRVRKNGEWMDVRSSASGKTATVWWSQHPRDKSLGLLYQLEVEGSFLYRYADQANRYLDEFRKGPPAGPLLRTIVFLLFTIPSLRYLLLRSNDK